MAMTMSYCLSDPEDYAIRGSLDKNNGKVLQWQLDKCTSNCKSDEEIDWFVDNMGVSIMFNQQLYKLNEYGEHVTENDLFYNVIAFNKRHVNANLVHHKIESEEAYSGTGIESQFDKNFFQLEFTTRLFHESSTEGLFSMIISMSPDIVYHKRSIYTFLDMLGDIGGLSDALFPIGGFFISVIKAITGS